MTSSITVEPYETVEFSESDTDSWQVVDPFDSENDDVITTESDVTTSDDEEDEDDVDVEEEEEDGDGDVVVDDVSPSESDVISSEYDDEDEDDDEEDEDDVISSDEDEEDEDDVITSEDEEEDDEDDVITPMSSDEMTNHTTQELNKVYKLDGLINGERDSYSDAEDAYVDRMRLEHMLYEEAMKEDAYIKRMQLEEEEHDDEDEDDYDEDLDDELIPRWLNNKFERQRMRKLGKKVYPKMKKSKRMVNQYNRPGCAGAKHGLGLKHNLIG